MDWTDVATVGVSAAAIIMSYTALRLSKGNNETCDMELFYQQYKELNNIWCEYFKLSQEEKDNENKYWYHKFKFAYEQYYNSIEYMSIKYLNKEISEKTFKNCMELEIKKICEKNEAQEYGVNIFDGWENIRKVYAKRACEKFSVISLL